MEPLRELQPTYSQLQATNSIICLTLIDRMCLGEAHEPCNCETWQKWLKKVDEINPNKGNCYLLLNM